MHSLPATCGFALQEVALEGQDKAFKDVIEPLESVSLNISQTTRSSLAEAGSPADVAAALTKKSASASTQVAVVSSGQVSCALERC
jgi:photosystem II oxygen-evolving enhancer protein 2